MGHRLAERVLRGQDVTEAVFATTVVLFIGEVTAANATIVRSNPSLLVAVGAGVVSLNVAGYGIGFVLAHRESRPTRVATILSVGTRDFAVVATLVIAAGLPTIASLPTVVFGVVEMTTSAGLARWFDR